MLKEDALDILREGFLDMRILARTVFKERFDMPFSSIHNQIFDALASGHRKIVIAAPRGFGKTTITNFLVPAYNIIYNMAKFIVPISCSNTSAVLQSENLKRELQANNFLQAAYGSFKHEERSFGKEMWTTSTGVTIFPRGAGQQVRGIQVDGHRPDLIVIDDLEDAEEVRNEELRKKLKEWFFADVLNSVRRNADWHIVFVGTVLHEDSLLENLLNDPTWYSVRLEICDDDYKSNWPDLMSDADVRELSESFKNQGLLDVFYREYRNMPISTEDAVFKQEYFNHYSETSEDFVTNLKHIETILIVDPAKTVKLQSADSAIIAVGLDLRSGRVYVRDVVSGKFYPDELYNEILLMAERLRVSAIGIEVTSLHEFITQPFKNEMVKRGKVFPLLELKAVGKKEERIAAMAPFYRQGYVFHNETCCAKLEGQLMSFPRSSLWDCMDALAYFVKIMSTGERFFQGGSPDDDEYDEFEALEKEPAMEDIGEWRLV